MWTIKNRKAISEHIQLRQLYERSECWGWTWEIGPGIYVYTRNTNDLGLQNDIGEVEAVEHAIEKIEVIAGCFVYVLENLWQYSAKEEDEEEMMDYETLIAFMKYSHSRAVKDAGVGFTDREKEILRARYSAAEEDFNK